MNSPLIELQSKQDETEVEAVLDAAFGLSRRTKTSYRLREGNLPATGLSLVIREAGFGVAACISFSPLLVGPGLAPALLLGPIAVHPAMQRRGFGSALMNEGLARAKAAGHKLILLVGDAPYYGRFGFAQVPPGQIDLPGPYDPKRLLAAEFAAGALAEAKGLALPPWRWREISALHAATSG